MYGATEFRFCFFLKSLLTHDRVGTLSSRIPRLRVDLKKK